MEDLHYLALILAVLRRCENQLMQPWLHGLLNGSRYVRVCRLLNRRKAATCKGSSKAGCLPRWFSLAHDGVQLSIQAAELAAHGVRGLGRLVKGKPGGQAQQVLTLLAAAQPQLCLQGRDKLGCLMLLLPMFDVPCVTTSQCVQPRALNNSSRKGQRDACKTKTVCQCQLVSSLVPRHIHLGPCAASRLTSPYLRSQQVV